MPSRRSQQLPLEVPRLDVDSGEQVVHRKERDNEAEDKQQGTANSMNGMNEKNATTLVATTIAMIPNVRVTSISRPLLIWPTNDFCAVVS